MGLGRALLCILLPPLAVLDKGCGTILIVALLTFCGWVFGVNLRSSAVQVPFLGAECCP